MAKKPRTRTRTRSRILAKSKEDERRVRDLLNSWGYTAKRTAQHSGNDGDSDVRIEEAPALFVEVKGGAMHERLLDNPKLLAGYVETAERQAKGCWCIFWRGPGQRQWKMTLKCDGILSTYVGEDAQHMFAKLVVDATDGL